MAESARTVSGRELITYGSVANSISAASGLRSIVNVTIDTDDGSGGGEGGGEGGEG